MEINENERKNLTISVAGLNIGMEYTHLIILGRCWNYLTQAEPDFSVTSMPEDWARELEAAEDGVSEGNAEFTCLHREIAMRLPEYDAFLMHGAAMEANGKGYLFTAPSGTGKTTHIRMWMDRYPGSVRCINGDKPIVRKIDGKFYFCGTPWRGKELYGEPVIVPVGGVCLLERSKENRIQRVPPIEVFSQLTHQVYFQNDQRQLAKFLQLFDDFLSSTPVYRLGCNMDISAAELSFATMTVE